MTKRVLNLSLVVVFVFALAFTYTMSFELAKAAEACDCIGGCICHPRWEGQWLTPWPHQIGDCDIDACGECNNPYPTPCW